MIQSKRNYGIDLLRLVSMFYVVVLHTLGKGGVLNATELGSAQYNLAWFMELWAYGAVNIFGIISGYVGFSEKEKKFNYANYLVMWLQVVAYGVAITLVYYFIDPELVTREDLWKMLFPVTNRLYWYFCAYTGLIFLIPLLNAGVRGCSRESLGKLLIVIILVFSVFAAFIDRFEMARGYSVLWLVLLYLVGAIMKKCRIGENMPAPAAFAGIVVCCVIAWLWKLHGPEFTVFKIKVGKGLFANYLGVTNLIAAMLHLIAFSKLRFPGAVQKVIAVAAPGAFAVYLLNNQIFIWRHVMTDNFKHLAVLPPYQILVRVLAFSFCFVLVAVSADWVRQKLFALLRIKQAAGWTADRIDRILDRCTRLLLG